MKAATVADIKYVHIGIMQTLLLEFERHRLPRLLRLRDKVDRGEVLNEVDFEFLCKEIDDACITKHLIVSYPELEEFCLHMGHMFKELCDRAVENEKK
ncbi:MAG: hypothetical protein IMF15_06570 [Proteobacteria bacterium]|nr:hypothetical protein [Pseudomonadota bacterium]